MKNYSDLIWAASLLLIAAASFFLGIQKGSISAEDELEEKLKQIKILENKNLQLSEELTSRGIYSYPQANLVHDVEDSQAMALITLNGQDPIKNLKLRRRVIEDYSQVERDVFTGAGQEGKFTDLGTLKPHNPSAFNIPLNTNEVALQLNYESRQNKWHQYIWIKKSKDGKIRSFWVITNGNSLVIDKHLDPDFPVNADGEIKLWQGMSINYSALEMNSTFPPKS